MNNGILFPGDERLTKLRVLQVLLVLTLVGLMAAPAMGADPTGAETLKENPEAPVDYVWVLVCGFLVMFMQAGFAMVETGFCRAKKRHEPDGKEHHRFCHRLSVLHGGRLCDHDGG